jgi:hypothetical protein
LGSHCDGSAAYNAPQEAGPRRYIGVKFDAKYRAIARPKIVLDLFNNCLQRYSIGEQLRRRCTC